MGRRERQEGITTEQAKGRTLRWQPLLPNLRRVNDAARHSGQTRFTALLHHVDVAAWCAAIRMRTRIASPENVPQAASVASPPVFPLPH
jgi:RNA-directed DNA polymerase